LLAALKKSQARFEQKEYDGAIDLLLSMISLSQFALELTESLLLYKVIAAIEFQRKAYKRALKICHLVIYLCALKDELSEIRLEMLQMAGLCQMRL